MTPEDYLDSVAERLSADGAQVTREDFHGIPAVIGYRPRFRLRWMATKLNLFTVVLYSPSITVAELNQFSIDALDYATAQKGRLRGLQTGVAAIPAMVGPSVDADTAAFAQDHLVRRFSAFAWPAAVDLSSGVVHRHQGRVAIGGVYASWMRQQTDLALNDPRW